MKETRGPVKPVLFTESTECRDCYKCLKHCPVKAIKIIDGHASIIQERCIGCGQCMKVCPAGAKKYRKDFHRAKLLLRLKKEVILSLAPSFCAQWPDYTDNQLIQSFKALGFSRVSETALGADFVSDQVRQLLKDKHGPWISSACPVSNELFQKYAPDLASRVTPLLSPLLAHASWLKKEEGPDIGVIFAGPCLAKKRESDSFNNVLETALTFSEIEEWWEQENIFPGDFPKEGREGFYPARTRTGYIYPVEGGMIQSIKSEKTAPISMLSVSGMEALTEILENPDELLDRNDLFCEFLACSGGCINGPGMNCSQGTLSRTEKVKNLPRTGPVFTIKESSWVSKSGYTTSEIPRELTFSREELDNALKRVGKTRGRDELNCGSCGYDTCLDFAASLLKGVSEPEMCAGYMRKLAKKKADALLRTIPTSCVIVNNNLLIEDCNEPFARLLGKEAMLAYQARPGLTGAHLKKWEGLDSYFSLILEDNQTIKHDIKLQGRIYHMTLFPIEKGRLAGGLFQDITEPSIQKKRIISKTREVMEKNLHTVQQIANLLGENAAGTEVILNSLIQSLGPLEVEEVDYE